MARTVHPAVGSTSWGLPLRLTQIVFAILVMSLAAYTVDNIRDWKEIRFTVAAVCIPFTPLMVGSLGPSVDILDLDFWHDLSSLKSPLYRAGARIYQLESFPCRVDRNFRQHRKTPTMCCARRWT